MAHGIKRTDRSTGSRKKCQRQQTPRARQRNVQRGRPIYLVRGSAEDPWQKAARSKRRRLARVQETLGARAWITECDLASFAVYCTAFEGWIAAVDNWRDHGSRFDDIAILNMTNIKDVYRSSPIDASIAGSHRLAGGDRDVR